VAVRSNKAWVCGRSLAGIVGSNPAGAWMTVCCCRELVEQECKTNCRFRSCKVGCICFQTHDFFPSVAFGPDSGPPLRGFAITLIGHTTLGMTPLDEGSARRRDVYLTIHNTHKRQTSVFPAGFEPTIPAKERRQNDALDHTATGIGQPHEIPA
jgi:hypothetical protein